MVDISQFTVAKVDQLTADDLIDKTLTIKITGIVGREDAEQPVSLSFEGDNGRPYRPCKSMLRVLERCWGRDGNKFVGRYLTLYRDPKVKFGGLEVGGIRISHMSHINGKQVMALTASKANKKPYTVEPLATPKEDPEIATLKAAGDTASKRGVDGYTTWKDTLTPEQKNKIKPFHSDWVKTAKAQDEIPEPPTEDDIPEADLPM